MCCQNSPDNILVDVGAECKIDLLRDARTTEVGIALFEQLMKSQKRRGPDNYRGTLNMATL